MLLHGVFTGILLISAISAITVLPPTNLIVECKNLKVTASWEYSKLQPQTRFRVTINGSAGIRVSETTNHQYDLSPFIWESEERYMAFHYVSVTAILGGSQSKPVESKTFSFKKYKTAEITCELDFPPLDLSLKDSEATVSLINPLHYYTELKQAERPDTATFKFKVSATGNNFEKEKECRVEEKHCRLDFLFPEGVEKCFNLTGGLSAGNDGYIVSFRDMNGICPRNLDDVWILVGVLLVIFVFIIIVVIIAIFKTNPWTMKCQDLSPPSPLINILSNSRKPYLTLPVQDISPVYTLCHENKPNNKEDDEDDGADDTDDNDDDPQDSCTDCDYLNFEKTECTSIHSEDEQRERSNYRSRNLQMDMGHGDMATGYRE